MITQYQIEKNCGYMLRSSTRSQLDSAVGKSSLIPIDASPTHVDVKTRAYRQSTAGRRYLWGLCGFPGGCPPFAWPPEVSL